MSAPRRRFPDNGLAVGEQRLGGGVPLAREPLEQIMLFTKGALAGPLVHLIGGSSG